METSPGGASPACTAMSSRGTDACLREHLFKRLDEVPIFASDCSSVVPQDIFIPSSSVFFSFAK